jgi:hypothetical protein
MRSAAREVVSAILAVRVELEERRDRRLDAIAHLRRSGIGLTRRYRIGALLEPMPSGRSSMTSGNKGETIRAGAA